jgi:plastocyanin
MRRCGAALALATGFSLVAAPVLAEDQRVTARNDFFDPRTVTVNVGEKVTWTNTPGGLHNVKFDDGSYEQPPDPDVSPWIRERTFNAPGQFRYYCEAHGGPNGVGMSGTVVVVTPGGAPPPPSDTTDPAITGLRASPSRFCNRRPCRRRGTRFVFQLSEAADVDGVVRPVGRPRGRRGSTFDANGRQGTNRVRFSGRGLRPGRYRLTLTATDSAGNKSDPARAIFTVRSP